MTLGLLDIWLIINICLEILVIKLNTLGCICSTKHLRDTQKLVAYLSCTHRASPPPFPLADNHLPFESIAISAKKGRFF